MHTHTTSTKENNSQSAAATATPVQGSEASSLEVQDNRPEAVTQWKLQGMADDSPQVAQQRSYQAMADNSPQVKQAVQLQALADDHTSKSRPVQRVMKAGDKIYRDARELAMGDAKHFDAWNKYKAKYGIDIAKTHLADTKEYSLDEFLTDEVPDLTQGDQKKAAGGISFFGERIFGADHKKEIDNLSVITFEWHQHTGQEKPHLKLVCKSNGTESHIMFPYEVDSKKLDEIQGKMNVRQDLIPSLSQKLIQEIKSSSSRVMSLRN